MNNSVTFSLRQDDGNYFVVGAAVTITYGDQGEYQQRKEIKLSGGFLSFDNPVAHFGIGSSTSIDNFTVAWPDGRITSYGEALPGNRFYQVRKR